MTDDDKITEGAVEDEPLTSEGAATGDVPVDEPVDELSSLRAKCAELEVRSSELNDSYLRKAADFENYRKRVQKEKSDAIDFANQSLLLDLIPVLDDFERALKAASAAKVATPDVAVDYAAAFTSLYDGLSMTESRLYATLENKWNLKRYVSEGQPFDPERHEALMMEKSAETTEAVVNEEFVKGYLLKERVVRTAKVKVLMPE